MYKIRYLIAIPILGLSLISCSSIISSATNKMAKNLSSAITNNDDLATVKAGAPAYLLMLDSFIEGDPEDSSMLLSASKLYSANSFFDIRNSAILTSLISVSRQLEPSFVTTVAPDELILLGEESSCK